jgi:hypothetical protein
MPLEKIFVNRDVFVRDEALPRLVLHDRVDEHRWVAIAKPVEEKRDVEGQDDRILEKGLVLRA